MFTVESIFAAREQFLLRDFYTSCSYDFVISNDIFTRRKIVLRGLISRATAKNTAKRKHVLAPMHANSRIGLPCSNYISNYYQWNAAD